MRCPKCKHEVHYQYICSGSMFECPNCYWLGTSWETLSKRFNWRTWATIVIGSAVTALIIAVILRDLGVV